MSTGKALSWQTKCGGLTIYYYNVKFQVYYFKKIPMRDLKTFLKCNFIMLKLTQIIKYILDTELFRYSVPVCIMYIIYTYYIT